MTRMSLALLALVAPAAAQTVLVSPYVQPGNGATLNGTDVKVLLWLTDQTPGEFTVEYGVAPGALNQHAQPHRTQLDFGLPKLRPPATPAAAKPGPLSDAPTDLDTVKREAVARSAVPVPDKEQHYFRYEATLTGLPFDGHVHYRVKLGARVVREGSCRTRASAGQPIRFVAVGDLANGKAAQNGIAWAVAQQHPDFMIGLGDIVYSQGRVSQYLQHFFTTFNDVPRPGPTTGAPLMASIPIYAVLGNHDVESAKLPDYPDAWGAFQFFRGPLNSPGVGPWNLPLGQDAALADQFRARAGKAYPALSVYSWDYGPAHFLALDSGAHSKVDEAKLREWIEADLRGSRQPWKFVCFHAPAFHTSREHYTEQKMRLLEPLFEECGVDVVFAGHVHNYQRSKPLRFKPIGGRDPRGRVSGEIRLDETFDGARDTTPEGVIHIVSGGGGATLYSVDFAKTVEALRKEHGANYTSLTAKYFAAKHSFSVIDLTPAKFSLRQIAITGEEVDSFTITKPAP